MWKDSKMSIATMLMSINNEDVISSFNEPVPYVNDYGKKLRCSDIKENSLSRGCRHSSSSVAPDTCCYFNKNVSLLSDQFPHVHSGLISSLLETASGDVCKTLHLIQQIEECSNQSDAKSAGSSSTKRSLKRYTRDWDSNLSNGNTSEATLTYETTSDLLKSCQHEENSRSEVPCHLKSSCGHVPQDVHFSSPLSTLCPSSTMSSSCRYGLSSSSSLSQTSDPSSRLSNSKKKHLLQHRFSEINGTDPSTSPLHWGVSQELYPTSLAFHDYESSVPDAASSEHFHTSSSRDSCYMAPEKVDSPSASHSSSSELLAPRPHTGNSLNFYNVSLDNTKASSSADLQETASQDGALRQNLKLLSSVVLKQHDKIVRLRTENGELLEEAMKAKAALERSAEELRQCREANLALQYYLSASNHVNPSEFDTYGGTSKHSEFPFNRRPDVF